MRSEWPREMIPRGGRNGDADEKEDE